MTDSQKRGYLYEILISHLLIQNNFLKCTNSTSEPLDCGVVSADGEIQGRGTKHQIDFIGIYTNYIPFIFPIRLLAECKYWKRKVDKSFIRAYIGVHKDISENYLASEINQKNRFLDVPIIFSANDFDKEAVKLAWAHGINLVSHSKLPLLKDILEFIKIVVDNINIYSFEQTKTFVKELITNTVTITQTNQDIASNLISNLSQTEMSDFTNLIGRIREQSLNTFLFATNEKGMLINLISNDEFPDNLFMQNDEVDCMVYFDENNSDENERIFYIIMNDDDSDRKFYFQANNELMKQGFNNLSLEDRMNAKKDYFSKLTIMKDIGGLSRLITLNVNLDTVRRTIIVE